MVGYRDYSNRTEFQLGLPNLQVTVYPQCIPDTNLKRLNGEAMWLDPSPEEKTSSYQPIEGESQQKLKCHFM